MPVKLSSYRERYKMNTLTKLIKFNYTLVIINTLLQLSTVNCFSVEAAKSELENGSSEVAKSSENHVNPMVLVGNFSVEHLNKSQDLKGNGTNVVNLLGEVPQLNGSVHDTNHHHQWGRGNGTGENETKCEDRDKMSDDDGHSDKIEQILWDIFVDEDDEDSTPNSEETDDKVNSDAISPSSSDERYREDETPEDPQDSTFEEILSDSIATYNDEDSDPPKPHVITKRSTDEESQLRSGSHHRRAPARHPYKKPQPHHHVARHPPAQNKKYRPTHFQRPTHHRVTSRRHTKQRSKPKKSSQNVQKYNEYMDIVLKRMNSMIKTKQMDPLMVNLFSGSNNKKPGGGAKKKPDEKKKKKKAAYSGHKKRKGAKNRARMEELEDEEGRSVSSESDSSGVELDNEHDDGVRGVGGVFIRRVGVLEEEGDSLDDDDDGEEGGEEEEVEGGRSFREIRALIVNGSMKRSTTGQSSPNTTQSPPSPIPSPSTTPTTTKEPEEPRGFDKAQTSAPPQSSASSEEMESPRKKQPNKGGNKKKPEKKNNKPKKKNVGKKVKPTRGVLKGLSSLKRFGDVDVVRQGDSVRIVRGRFSLGPVTLEIVPRGGGGKKKPEDLDDDVEEERSKKNKGKNNGKGKPKTDSTPNSNPQQPPKVTAIARELKGIIEIRIKKNSPTTIKRLRVFPPSSVKIKSNDKVKPSTKTSGSSVPRYNRVTPVATHRLRQIASAVVRQADVKRKSSSLENKKESGSSGGGGRVPVKRP